LIVIPTEFETSPNIRIADNEKLFIVQIRYVGGKNTDETITAFARGCGS
jgi:hypothetical protein